MNKINQLTDWIHGDDNDGFAVAWDGGTVDDIEKDVLEHPSREIADRRYDEIGTPYRTGKHAQLKDNTGDEIFLMTISSFQRAL